jgi:hypothetical protein
MRMRQIVLADADDLAGPWDGGLDRDFGWIQALIRLCVRQRLSGQGGRRPACFEEGQHVGWQLWVKTIQFVHSLATFSGDQCSQAGLTLVDKRDKFH